MKGVFPHRSSVLRPSNFWALLKESAARWNRDNALRLSASLSYYTVFSLGPLLIVAVGVAGLVFGRDAATGELRLQLRGLVGSQGAEAVQALLSGQAVQRKSSDVLASLIGIGILLFGATSVFSELNDALNLIWRTDPKKTSGLKAWLKARLLSFAMVLSVGFLLLVSLVVSAAIAAAGNYLEVLIGTPQALAHLLSNVVSFGLITVLFALIFKVLPDLDIQWRDVWTGAALTSFLFTVGKLLIGLYLGKVAVASTYGASASVVIVLLWTYYSSLILYFGAEFTEVYSRRAGSRCSVPSAAQPRPLTLARSP